MKRCKAVILILVMIQFHPSFTQAEQIVNAQEWYTYDRMREDLKLLKRKYRDEMVIKLVGKSEFGQNIWAAKLGHGKDNILILGGHHGREWLTTSLVMTKLEYYLHAYKTNQKIFGYDSKVLDEVSIWFIPMVNPDGIRIQQEGIGFLPKQYQKRLVEMNNNSTDFDRWKANGLGIDLNRQYPAGWESIKEKTIDPSYQYYKGKFPMQAKEVKAVVTFTREIDPLMAVTYHSSGRVLYWYFKNDQTVVKRDKKIADQLSAITGYPLDQPEEHAVGGGFSDWFVTEFKRPSFTPEISYFVEDTNPPISVFQEEWNRNKKVGIYLAAKSKNLFLNSNVSSNNEAE
ncbi:M14 family zinc carboxypeptidase [Sutcliffiella horikoshii]|uniref:M14 family zinc carboxypeptidase n=1 Tax=Sutcliffiella horikoshii TaxID=79883 RepID=UPI001F220AA8|nr:M14 family zinc carboxypeptidase [Sutcliffiella horikoshii]MCG1022561.1 carboxypeptidase [Sutcliffiella horikoshii]